MRKASQLARIILFSLSLFFTQSLWAQDQGSQNQTMAIGLRSQGPMPEDLKRSFSDLYKADLKRVKDWSGDKVKKTQSIEEGSYAITRMMATGLIVYGDPVTKMLNRIADTLLKDYPELRSEIRIYTVKSSEVNAFTSLQGMIFINVGLVAQAENEAQLAFILSHEIIHYMRSHIITKMQSTEDDIESAVEYDPLYDRSLTTFLRIHMRDREMENESDSLGIQLFYSKSPYSKSDVERVFDMLQFSDMPFNDVEFDKTFFNTKYYSFAKDTWLDSVKYPVVAEDYDDSRLTHPNIRKRRINCANALMSMPDGGAHFVVTTPEEFESIRHLARIECIRQQIIENGCIDAFYNTWLLANERPDDVEIELLMAHSLYNRAKREITSSYYHHEGHDQYGEIQQVRRFYDKVPDNLIVMATVHKIWDIYKKYPHHDELKLMAEDLMRNMYRKYSLTPSQFSLKTPQEVAADSIAADTVDTGKKYDRLKQRVAIQAPKLPQTYIFTDLLRDDSTFRASFSEQMKPHYEDTIPIQRDSLLKGKVLLIDNSYLIGNKKKIRIPQSDKREALMTKMAKKRFAKLGCETVDYTIEGVHSMNDAEEYNNFVIASENLRESSNNSWFDSKYSYYGLTKKAMDRLSASLGTTVMCSMTVQNKEGKPFSEYGPLILMIVPPSIPIMMYVLAAEYENTSTQIKITGIESGKEIYKETDYYSIRDSRSLIDQALYDACYNFKTGKDRKKGFMGAHLSLHAGASFGLAGLQPWTENEIFAITPWASAQWALNRTLAAELTYNYHKASDAVNNTFASDPSNSGLPLPSKEMHFASLGLHYNFKNTAFWGTYGGWGFHIVQLRDSNPSAKVTNLGGLYFSLGREYVVAKYLSMNIEARYAYTFGLIRFMRTSNQYYIDPMISNALTLKIGFGLLPF